MTLGSMRQLGVHRLLVSCLRCRHEALIDVSSYRADMTVPGFIPRMKCTQCGGKRVDVRPRPKTYEDIDGVIRVRKAIDALDHAIENRWGESKQASKGVASAYRPISVEKGINNPDDLDGLPGG
jgi:hypothetical protein